MRPGRLLAAGVVACVAFLTAACGQKGPLYLPEKGGAVVTAPAEAPPPPPVPPGQPPAPSPAPEPQSSPQAPPAGTAPPPKKTGPEQDQGPK